MKKLKKIGNILSYLLMIIILVLIVYAIITSKDNSGVSLFGHKMYVIKTNSMEPTLEVDSVILVKEYDEDIILDKGEIITFKFSNDHNIPNTHRIIGYYYEYLEGNEIKYESSFSYENSSDFYKENPNTKIIGYRTEGDNPNIDKDLKPVLFESVYGVFTKKLVIISFLYGLLTNFVGFLLIILVPLFILLILQLLSLYKLRESHKLDKEIEEESKKRKEIEERIKREAIEEFLKNKQ